MRAVDSTNALARRILAAAHLPPKPFGVTAWEQMEGRGRRGNRWLSPPGGGVYLTSVLPVPAARVSSLPLVAAAAVCGELDAWVEPACRIKWPNDLLVDGSKVGGLLIESLPAPGERRWALVGVGVNLLPPPGLPAAGGLRGHGVGAEEGAALTARLAGALVSALSEAGEPAAAAAAFRRWSVHREGERLSYRDASGAVHSGRFRGLDESGFLRLESDGEERRLTAAELVE